MNRKKKSKTLIFFLILSLLILLADYFGLLKPIKSFFESKLVIPVRLRFTKPVSPVTLSPEGSCSNKDLQIDTLKAQIAGLKEENLSSKKLLGAPLPPDWKFLPAKVIGVSEEEIIINKGEKEKVRKEMVLLAEGIYLGKIRDLSVETAKVELLTSPDSRAVVKILDRERLTLVGKGLLFGKGGSGMEIRQILVGEEVKEGDLVVAADAPASYSLLIGKVIGVNFKKGEVFKTALVKREIDVNKLETVFLVIP